MQRTRSFLVAQLVKNLPAMQETLVQFLGQEDGSGRSAGEGIGYLLKYSWVSSVAQLVKNLLAMWETLVQSLGWENPLEKGTASPSNTLAWRIPWAALSRGSQESDTTGQLSLDSLQFIGCTSTY